MAHSLPFRSAGASPRRAPPSTNPEEKEDAIQTKLFVGNLDFDTTQDDLRALFGEAGEVVSVTVPTDRDTGRPRGFAFVELSTPEQATAAIGRLDGYELHGRTLRVNEATERPARTPGFRPGGFAPGPPPPRARPKGSRRNLRARKRGF